MVFMAQRLFASSNWPKPVALYPCGHLRSAGEVMPDDVYRGKGP